MSARKGAAMSLIEIAEEMGISKQRVSQILARALRKLRTRHGREAEQFLVLISQRRQAGRIHPIKEE